MKTTPADAVDKPFSWPVRVYYEDTDAGGVVYYANYLRFLERARTEWLRAAGVDQARLREEQGIIFVVADVQVEYLQPARLDDMLEVTVEIARSGRASLNFGQQVHRGDATLCRATVRAGCVGADDFRPRRLPQSLRGMLG
ncbi:MAG: tol-pal system-associated acyl-CoA thioesterase [Gammaproteobacteria bacterium]|nr:tol-pal system-associated acyl-CoA thioesterase [Gammaproteobacteria bacterium]NNF61485.1 tol-pal system-associated acyl-CoA thioesterase [Gammaproteobacteria bacterium]